MPTATVSEKLEEFLDAARSFVKDGRVAPFVAKIIDIGSHVSDGPNPERFVLGVALDLAKGVSKRKYGTIETPAAVHEMDVILLGGLDDFLGSTLHRGFAALNHCCYNRALLSGRAADTLARDVRTKLDQQRAECCPAP